MTWLWWILIVYGAGIIVGMALGRGCGLVAVAAPVLPLIPLVRWIRRPSDWWVARSLKALRPILRSAQPAIVKAHVMADWGAKNRVQVYLACALERDRQSLDAHLEEWAVVIREELLRQRAPEEVAKNLTLHSASKEYIDRAGGLYNYLHQKYENDMDNSDFVDAQGTVWKIYSGLPSGYPDTGDRTANDRAQAGLTFRASTGEVRVLPRAAIPRRASIPPVPATLGGEQPATRPITPSWGELLRIALPWPAA